MEKLTDVLQVVLPVVVMILLGILANRRKIVSAKGIADMKSLLVNICIPAVILSTFYATEFTWSVALLCLIMAGVTVGAGLLGIVLNKGLHINQPLAPYLCTTIEGGMMGYALFILLFGQENLYHLALLDLGNAVILFPFLLTKLRLRSQSEVSGREIVRSLATPINFSFVIGLTLSISGLGKSLSVSAAGGVFDALLSFLSAPTGALILLIVGFGLDFSNVRWDETIKTVLSRAGIFAVFGVLVFQLVTHLLPDDPLYGYGVMMAFLLPPSFIISVFAKGEQEEAYVGTVLAVYTLLTLIGYGVLAWCTA